MTLNLTANLTSQSASIAALRGRRWRVLSWRVVVIVTAAAFAALYGSLRGQADEEEDDDAVVPGERQFVLTEQQFNQMVFGGRQPDLVANGFEQSVTSSIERNFRKRTEATVESEIQTVDQRVSLTEAQKKKLRLAGRGDVAQVVSRAAELRPKLTSKPMSQQQYTELLRELQPLRMVQKFGIVGENSLFRKTLRGTLTDEQCVRYRTLERERQNAIIEAALQNWERLPNGFKLTGESRRKFVDLILDQGQLPDNVGPYGHYIVLLAANHLRAEVMPLVPEAERQRFETQIGQAKRLEPTLKMYGLWPVLQFNEDDETSADETKD